MLRNDKTKMEVVKSNPASRTTAATCREIENLDLKMIKLKLTHPRDLYRWTKEFADEVEKEYKRYLILRVKYPGNRIAPSVAVDIFWHQHILDTKKYFEDCARIFGSYMHHYPYFGLIEDGVDGAEQLNDSFDESHLLYEREFGEIPLSQRKTDGKPQRKKTKSRSKAARKKK